MSRRLFQFLVLCTAIILHAEGTFAQRTQATVNRQQREAQAEQESREKNVLGLVDQGTRPGTPADASLALDIPVDPATYVLGPGDVLGINLRGGVGMFYSAQVTPEGNLIIPQMPMLHVDGLTLAAAVDTIAERWGGELEPIPVDAALLTMRRMRVSVGGEVKEPGQYVVTPADRALTLVDLAGGVTEAASDRHAVLIHADGTRQPVDRLRYLHSGLLDANPLLTSGSHLVIQPKPELEAWPRIEVDGAVMFPGSYEWVKGDRLVDVLELAGGVGDAADRDSVQLTRFRHGQPETERIRLSQLGDFRGPALDPGDLVYVKRSEAREPLRATVLVKGEVKRPGRYPIVSGKTRVLEVLEWAGGVTEQASLRGAHVWQIRPGENSLVREVQRLDTLDATLLNPLEIDLLRDVKRTLDRDYLPVDFELLLHGGEGEIEANNAVLYDSLVISVPPLVYNVLVLGAVELPGYYEFHENWGYKDYIEEAGGYLKEADKRNVRHLPYEGAQFVLARNQLGVYAGDLIYVPEKWLPPFWTVFRDYFSVFLQAATLAILILK